MTKAQTGGVGRDHGTNLRWPRPNEAATTSRGRRTSGRRSTFLSLLSLVALIAAVVGTVVVVPSAEAGSVPIALIQQSSSASVGSNSETLALASAVHPGDALIASFNNTHDGLTVTSISGGGVTWHRANIENDAITADSEIWYGLNAPGGATTVTVNLSGTTSGVFYALNVSEWSGVGGLDQAPPGTFSHSGTVTAVAPAVTPQYTGDLFIGDIGSSGSATPSGPPGGGFTAFPVHSGIYHTAYGYLVATDAATHQYSQPLSQSGIWSGTSASFFPLNGITVPAPTVTSISPTSGPATGGTSVTITGTNLSGASAVRFGTTASSSVTVNSATSITATAPAEPSGVISYVQSSSAETTSGSTETVTLSANVKANDGLVLSYGNVHDGLTISSVSGGGVTWTKANQENDGASGTADTEIWYGIGSTGGTGTTVITATLTGTAAKTYPINVSEWSGIGGLDQAPAGTFNHTGSSVANGPPITPTNTGDLFISAVGANAPSTGSPGGGFTALSTGSATQVAFGRLIATDSASHEYTQGLTASTTWSGTGVAFYPQTATTPIVDVTVTTPGGTSATSAADQFTY